MLGLVSQESLQPPLPYATNPTKNKCTCEIMIGEFLEEKRGLCKEKLLVSCGLRNIFVAYLAFVNGIFEEII